jgi:hypothetical protein
MSYSFPHYPSIGETARSVLQSSSVTDRQAQINAEQIRQGSAPGYSETFVSGMKFEENGSSAFLPDIELCFCFQINRSSQGRLKLPAIRCKETSMNTQEWSMKK